MNRLTATTIAVICDWIGNRLHALATRFWNRAKRIRLRQATRASTTETEERMWERASVEAGYVALPEYIERHGADKVVTIPHHGRIG